MGESERYIDKKLSRITIGDDRNALINLIIINAVLFVSLGLVQIIFLLQQSTYTAFEYQVLRWFILPAKLSFLATKPWTILTFMFVHVGILYTFINMLWLWAFGNILQSLSGNSHIFPLYIYGGLAGAVIFIATQYAFPQLRSQIEFAFTFGSNASILAIAAAATTLSPDYRLFRMLNGGIPLWILTVLYVIVDFAGIRGNTALMVSHAAGAATGFFFMVSLRRGHDWGAWMNTLYGYVIHLFSPDKPAASATPEKIREKIFYQTGGKKPFTKHAVITQQRIDDILDKINLKGFEQLTEEEKNILKKARETDF